MSFSNTDTGSKPADPYTQKNLNNEASLEEKITGLVKFAEKQKFCMMTTRIADSGLLVSRCMALAAEVSYITQLHRIKIHLTMSRRATASTSSSTRTPSLARLTTSSQTLTSTSDSSHRQASGRPSAAELTLSLTAILSRSTILLA